MKSNGFTKYSPTEIHCTHILAYINNLKLRTVYKNYLIFMVHVSHLFGISRNNCIYIYSVNKMHVHFDFNEVPITFSPSPFLLRFFFELKKKQNNKLRFQFKLKS